jgi:PKD repeat protein
LEDELGQTNVDIQELYVESTPPQPQFTIMPTNKRTKASEFHLDANSTTDIDMTNKNDNLEYRREFSNPNVATVVATEDNNKKIVVQFNEVGKHTITLTVTDMYGKISKIEKQVEVTSILRPELTVIPNAITRGRNVSFSVKTNKPIINYQWSFGDGENASNQQDALQHIYQKIGIYNVSVMVSDSDGNNNTIVEKVFIGETGFPIAAFRIKNQYGFFLQRSE